MLFLKIGIIFLEKIFAGVFTIGTFISDVCCIVEKIVPSSAFYSCIYSCVRILFTIQCWKIWLPSVTDLQINKTHVNKCQTQRKSLPFYFLHIWWSCLDYCHPQVQTQNCICIWMLFLVLCNLYEMLLCWLLGITGGIHLLEMCQQIPFCELPLRDRSRTT